MESSTDSYLSASINSGLIRMIIGAPHSDIISEFQLKFYVSSKRMLNVQTDSVIQFQTRKNPLYLSDSWSNYVLKPKCNPFDTSAMLQSSGANNLTCGRSISRVLSFPFHSKGLLISKKSNFPATFWQYLRGTGKVFYSNS